ncbi:hypothetical protein QN362_18875, partial [Actimicrobium sp. CCC2.4]|uniref:hypothetical protein n=1 Tax=Actimicrobium sp. CCC2.4 TaxID=3048606 RepID=UPI002B245399
IGDELPLDRLPIGWRTAFTRVDDRQGKSGIPALFANGGPDFDTAIANLQIDIDDVSFLI